MKWKMAVKSLLAGVAFATASMALASVTDFHDLDVDEDGVLSVEEADEIRNLQFHDADTDKDGVLSEQEYFDSVSKGLQT